MVRGLLAFVQILLICTCLKIETRRANHCGNWNARWMLGRHFYTGMAAPCAGGEGASNDTPDLRWGSVWWRPGRSAAVASLHSTESARLHQPLLCLDMHTDTQTHTHTHTHIYIHICMYKYIYIYIYICGCICNFSETYITRPVYPHQS